MSYDDWKLNNPYDGHMGDMPCACCGRMDDGSNTVVVNDTGIELQFCNGCTDEIMGITHDDEVDDMADTIRNPPVEEPPGTLRSQPYVGG